MFEERFNALESLKNADDLRDLSLRWLVESGNNRYSYTKDWFGLPLIQRTDDIVQMSELISEVQPTCIIETGIARGGSLSFYASMLCLLDIADGIDPRESPRQVIGIDIDLREQNRAALDKHPFNFKMQLIQGSSTDSDIIAEVHQLASRHHKVLVVLDSNHTHKHVLAELEAYASLVSVGSYCVVFDTIIEDLPKGYFTNRDWDVGNNPKTAVHEWLRSRIDFSIDQDIDNKLLVSVAPNGYLKRNTK